MKPKGFNKMILQTQAAYLKKKKIKNNTNPKMLKLLFLLFQILSPIASFWFS